MSRRQYTIKSMKMNFKIKYNYAFFYVKSNKDNDI
jgi:hypothetical protein